MNLGSKIHLASGSQEDLGVVTREEESTANPSHIPDRDKKSERSPTLDFIEEVLSDSSSDDMPTHLKYSRL